MRLSTAGHFTCARHMQWLVARHVDGSSLEILMQHLQCYHAAEYGVLMLALNHM